MCDIKEKEELESKMMVLWTNEDMRRNTREECMMNSTVLGII
jgi:hypothetical protein